jgi:zinc transporter ZupT
MEPEPSLMVGNIEWTCKEEEHTDAPTGGTTAVAAVTASTWWSAIGCTVLISILSLIGVLALPLKRFLHQITNVLVAFAAGALLGDAVLHLIPLSYGLDRYGKHAAS